MMGQRNSDRVRALLKGIETGDPASVEKLLKATRNALGSLVLLTVNASLRVALANLKVMTHPNQ
jgi:hypothetical protein